MVETSCRLNVPEPNCPRLINEQQHWTQRQF